MPTSQPNLIQITREEVKTGHNAMHSAFEAGWPAAFAKAKSPNYYLAMVSITGPNEAWYIIPFASHAALGESMKLETDNKALSADLARLQKGDADHINSTRTIHAVARTDLSYGAYPDMALARFWEVTTFRVRPGSEEAFANVAKAYAAAAKRAAPNMGWRTYEVIAGLPGPTYLVFSSVRSFADFDQAMKDGMEIGKAFTSEEQAMMEKFGSSGADQRRDPTAPPRSRPELRGRRDQGERLEVLVARRDPVTDPGVRVLLRADRNTCPSGRLGAQLPVTEGRCASTSASTRARSRASRTRAERGRYLRTRAA